MVTEFAACPPEALTAAESLCGCPVRLKEITDRRGSAVWKATGPNGAVAVKVGYGEGVPVTGREAAVLKALGLPGYQAASGPYVDGAWLVTRWFEGPSTWKLFEPVRENGRGHESALQGAVALCRAVANLHATGWVHADLQPSHGIHTRQGVRLIDFSWAHGAGVDAGPPFRGTMAHLTAPEVAADLTAERPTVPTRSSDVYALAGVVWTCLTGAWPLDYPAAGIDQRHMALPDLWAVIAGGTIPLDGTRPWPQLQDILHPVLFAGPDSRPTAAELADALLKAEP